MKKIVVVVDGKKLLFGTERLRLSAYNKGTGELVLCETDRPVDFIPEIGVPLPPIDDIAVFKKWDYWHVGTVGE